MSGIETLYERFPNKPWNLNHLVNNTKMSYEFIKEHPELDAINDRVPFEVAITDVARYKPYFTRCDDKNLTQENILSNPELPWDMENLMKHPIVTWEFIQNTPQFDWVPEYFSNNPNITIKIICENPDVDWIYGDISMSESITMDDIEANIDLPWEFDSVSYNENLTIEFLLAYYDEDEENFDFSVIGPGKFITLEDVRNNPYLPWEAHMWLNPKILSVDTVIKNADLFDNVAITCAYGTPDNINKYPDFNWDKRPKLRDVTKYPILHNISMEYINNNPQIKWNYKRLSGSESLTAQFIMDNIDKDWDWAAISFNQYI